MPCQSILLGAMSDTITSFSLHKIVGQNPLHTPE